jgi:hypothetical protein
MTLTALSYAKTLSMAVLAAALVVSSETPLLASPQSGQSPSSSQKPEGALPDAPEVQPAQAQSAQDQQQSQVPSGTAGAKAADVKGAPVAKPAGAAVAPVRQRGHHSLLIKVGLVAGAAIAVGTAVALSAGSPSRPPGTSATSAQR